MSQQKEFVERSRREGFGLDTEGKPSGFPTHSLNTLKNALAIASKDICTSDLHFIYESIQNVQDNKYKDGVVPDFKFYLLDEDPTNSDDSKGCLCVINN